MVEGLYTKKVLLDAEQMRRVVRRMAGELLERNRGVEGLVMVGIRTRGVPLAERLVSEVEAMEGLRLPTATLDITLYRDDLSLVAPNPVVKETTFPGPIEGKTLILCDDVLYTGRTVRAALDALVDIGRPKSVLLAVLVDRGWRELPIHADLVGLELPTAASEVVKVCFAETDDGQEAVKLLDRHAAGAEARG
jgi:pyrimidine operon attenuation protein / uracil phosphoribosyltransferase